MTELKTFSLACAFKQLSC